MEHDVKELLDVYRNYCYEKVNYKEAFTYQKSSCLKLRKIKKL